MTRSVRFGLIPLVCVLAVLAPPVYAQSPLPESGGRVYALVNGDVGDGSSVFSGVGAGVRLMGNVGLDVELTRMAVELSPPDGLFGQGPGFPVSLFNSFGIGPSPFAALHAVDVTVFLTKFTVEFPVAGDRVFPFLSAGGGVGRVTDPSTGFLGALSPADLGFALALSGGLDVRLWRGFGVGADLRWLRLLRNFDHVDVTQVAARLSYRF